jgi:hypothetical protein
MLAMVAIISLIVFMGLGLLVCCCKMCSIKSGTTVTKKTDEIKQQGTAGAVTPRQRRYSDDDKPPTIKELEKQIQIQEKVIEKAKINEAINKLSQKQAALNEQISDLNNEFDH